MILFLVLLFPIAIAIYFLQTQEKKYLPAVYVGVMAGLLFCAFRIFFMYEHRLINASFLPNYLYYFFRNGFLPILFVYGLFYLFTKDIQEYKISSFFPLISSFYAIYLPYYVVSNTESVYTPYSVFLMPVLYLAMIVQISMCVKNIYNDKVQGLGNSLVPNIIIILFYMLYPSCVDTLYAINKFVVIACLVSIVYIAYPIINLKKYFNKDY